MKNFGELDPKIIELLQGQQDFIIAELNNAVEEVLDKSSEGNKELLDSLNYILEQSTNHKQDVERDLKDTRNETEQLYMALQQYAANNDENMTEFVSRTNAQFSLIIRMQIVLTMLGFGILGIVGAILIKVI